MGSIGDEASDENVYNNILCSNIIWNKCKKVKIKLSGKKLAPEPYVTSQLSKSQWSVVAHLAAGILALALEVGWFKSIQEEGRLCVLCDLGEVESETHFLLYCPLYDDLTELFF